MSIASRDRCFVSAILESWGLSEKPKILCVGQPTAEEQAIIDQVRSAADVVAVDSSIHALAHLARSDFSSVWVWANAIADGLQLSKNVPSARILECMPDGVALLDADNVIIWANSQLRQWLGDRPIRGVNFYTAFEDPEILGPDFCPFHTAISAGESSSSTLQTKTERFYRVHVAPVRDPNGPPQFLVVTVRDTTDEVEQQHKLEAIHRAGAELADLTPEEVFEMTLEERIELLKSNIVRYTKDLLNYDVVEIRLMDQKTAELIPLLAEGIVNEAQNRQLFARPQANGVTGFVAATGKSYLCEDTTDDPLYIQGSEGAKSSLTVPLVWHDQVIGTFNVESPEPRAFRESDLQFLEIFSRNVAMALNTLELLVAQQANTAQASVEAIHGEVAMPVDAILNDAVNLMELYIGHETKVVERVQRILRNARDIKQLIHKVGQEMTPAEAIPETSERSAWPRLRNRRVLVVDQDENVRSAAHALLERFGCVVETAHEGTEAILMIRNSGPDVGYDVIIADIRLPDISGFDLLTRLQDFLSYVPLVLMTGFGYDPGHSIVKARQSGLILPNAILYKPFRMDQLLGTVDSVIEAAEKLAAANQ